jgi:glycosyltransferase involved in cell wall biosynthesis
METIKLSVIIPAYKFAKFLEVNLLTVLNQKTNFDYEVIVRDDFSKDGSDKILLRLKNYFPNLIVHEATENWGVHKNIRFLLEQAKGEYVAYLDGDDYYVDPYKLQKQVDFLDENKDYVMYGTGYCILRGENEYIPGDGVSTFWSLFETVKTEQLFDNNYVGFGRVFRNIKGIYKDYMDKLPYLDYALNYELSLHGLIKNDDWYGGVYREHFGGVLTSLNSDEKEKTHESMKNLLKERHKNSMNLKLKPITIIDCYVHSEEIENRLFECVKSLKENNNDVLLISNTTIKKEIIDLVDFYFYDKNNKLFSEEKFDTEPFVLWKRNDTIDIYEIINNGLQKHGLSVMINLFRALNIASSLGYKYFQRIEVDAIIGEEGFNFMKNIPNLCDNYNKKGLFYFNEDDISFHYFFCEIDFFVKNVKNIYSEDDYIQYLERNFEPRVFKIVEQYVRLNLNSVVDDLIIRTNSDMITDFGETKWNTVTSESSLNSKYNGCTTEFYKVFDINMNPIDGIAVLSYNYRDSDVNRVIKYNDDNGEELKIEHILYGKNTWSYNLLPNNTKKIEIFEKENLIFAKENKDINSYIVLR